MNETFSAYGLWPLVIIGSLVFIIFAFSWTSCVGPILASILVLAGISATLLKGVALLAVYSLGLSIPFLLTSLFWVEAMNYIKRFSGFCRFVPIISGGLLIILGIIFLTNEFSKVVIWLYNKSNFPAPPRAGSF